MISRIDTVLVQFSIPESEYLRIVRFYNENRDKLDRTEEGRQGGFELILADGSVHPHNGVLDFAEREVDPSTGTLLLQASFPNPNQIIRPGQYARIKFVEQMVDDAVIVPQRCVIELQGKYSVFVITSDNTIERRNIEVGERMDDMWLISSGLEAGERVVIDALQKVGSGAEVNPVPSDFKSITNQ